MPAVTPPIPFVGFSASPTDEEFLRGRLFAEPLVPIGGRATTREENRELAGVLEIYRRGTPDVTAPIDNFLRQHRDTPWRASLLANVGGQLRDAGAYTRALATWDEAWTLTKQATDPHGRAVADLAVAEWLMLSMSLMRIDDVESRLAAIAKRDVQGSAGNRIAQVRQRLAWWREHPSQFVPAEARALERLVSFARKGVEVTASPSPSPRVFAPKQKHSRISRRLGWLIGPAKRLGLTLRAMRRGADASFAAGTLVSLKNGHVLALLESQGDRFTAYDPVLNRDLSVNRAVLEEEASDFALMSPDNASAAGWTEVFAAALPVQNTQCPPGTPDYHEPCPCMGGAGGGGNNPSGMPTYRFHHAIAGLVIQDTPVTYSVPRGPSPLLSVSYSSRSVEDPAVFTFSNLGPKWRFDWRAYILERPLSCWSAACADPELRVVLRGGGFESHEPPGGAWTTLGPHWRSHAVVVRTSSSPLTYERRLPDGSKEVYSVSEGTFDGARLFLSDVVDPQGQTIHLTYDAQFRIVSLTDAIGQVTTLSYEHASDPLKITKITDPFGRFATFTYNAAGQLASITDAINLTSTFEYGPNDFILGMTTPYGTTTFRTEDPLLPSRIYLEATDPLGGTERVEYWGQHPSLPATVAASEVPTGFTAANHDLDRFVTLHWDTRAMLLQPRAVASATITKLLLRGGPDYFGGSPNTSIPSSIKRPLEGRIWYQYPNQVSVSSPSVGTGVEPSVTARVLDDGSSQIRQATYNPLGRVTSRTDPLGRRTSYVYAANNIDLLEVRQTTGSMNDLLAAYGNYTAQHRPQSATDAANQTTTFTYNSAGQRLSITNAKNETTTYTYNSAGYLETVTGPVAGATSTYTYDALGRIRTHTDSDGDVLTGDYDALDRLTRTTYPDGTYDQQTYHRLDVAESRDRLGRITYYLYDAQWA